MENLPGYISWVFGCTTILTIFIFYKAANYSKTTGILLLLWIGLQACIALSGFYKLTDTMPPRFALLGLPALVFIIVLFLTPTGKRYIDALDIKTLTALHMIRIPVEIVLFWLFLHKAIPKLMTFEGRNVDILSGLTAPLVYYFGFVKKRIGKRVVIAWNYICVALLLNIVMVAILSVPSAFQQLAFAQPDVAILYFPFNWLPCCVVPLVLLSHLATIRQLMKRTKETLR